MVVVVVVVVVVVEVVVVVVEQNAIDPNAEGLGNWDILVPVPGSPSHNAP